MAPTIATLKSRSEALEKMQQQVAAIEFDVTLVSADVCGLPLAAFAKSLRRRKAPRVDSYWK